MRRTAEKDLSPHGRRLKAALKGYSQQWLSRETGIEPSTISGWMSGRLLPTEGNWWRAGKALGQDRTAWAHGLPFAEFGGGKSLKSQGTLHKKAYSITTPAPTQPPASSGQETDDVFQMESGTMHSHVSEFLQAVPSLTIAEVEQLWTHLQQMRGRAPARRAETGSRKRHYNR